MADVIASRQCTICKENRVTFKCQQCKELFCIKHMTIHTVFERLMIEHDGILKEMLDQEQPNESSIETIRCQIDQWEKNMIGKVRDKAEQARERLVQLVDNGKKVTIENAQDLIKKIQKQHETEDLLKQDIQRLTQNIIQIKQTIDKATGQYEVELYIEPDYMIDWNHLIYVRKKYVTAASSVVNKKINEKDSKGAKSTMNSNQQRTFNSYYTSSSQISSNDDNDSKEMNPSSELKVRPLNERSDNSATIVSSLSQLEKQQPSIPATMFRSITSPSSNEVIRVRRPLYIVDPVSHKACVMQTESGSADTNNISLQTAAINNTTGSSLPSYHQRPTKPEN